MPRIQTVGCAWTSQAAWLSIEPDLFWGFWGQCFNDYRETSPHEGYEIINRWAQRFRESLVSQSIRKRLAERSPAQLDGQLEPYQVTDLPGAFYAFTSNVDAHHFDWFHACEIQECHGNTELYQCESPECPSATWRAPIDFPFKVDTSTMRTPRITSPLMATASPLHGQEGSTQSTAH